MARRHILYRRKGKPGAGCGPVLSRCIPHEKHSLHTECALFLLGVPQSGLIFPACGEPVMGIRFSIFSPKMYKSGMKEAARCGYDLGSWNAWGSNCQVVVKWHFLFISELLPWLTWSTYHDIVPELRRLQTSSANRNFQRSFPYI